MKYSTSLEANLSGYLKFKKFLFIKLMMKETDNK